MTLKTVYVFGGSADHSDPRQKDKTVAGGKGANLAEMASIGLPVPPGFTITTEACVHYYSNGETYPAELAAQAAAGLDIVANLRPSMVRLDSKPALELLRLLDGTRRLLLNLWRAERAGQSLQLGRQNLSAHRSHHRLRSQHVVARLPRHRVARCAVFGAYLWHLN